MTDKILDPTIGHDHKIDNGGMVVEEEIIDVKIIIENDSRDRGRQNFRSNDNRSRSLTPRGNRRYNS